MQVIHLPIGWTIVLDCVAWSVIQPAIGYLGMRLPASALDEGGWLYRVRGWEKGGSVYQRWLKVKRWKSALPSGGTVFPGGFSMKRIVSRDRVYLERWTRETRRAELTHWTALAASGFFFLWNPPSLGLAMVLYAALVNLPCIAVQRYNRAHLVRLLA